MHKKPRCFKIRTVFAQGHGPSCVLFVGFASVALSLIVLLSSISSLTLLSSEEPVPGKTKAVRSVNFLFALVAISLSCYQIVISILLLWHGFSSNRNVFLCSLWYVSHLSILVVYFFLFCSKTAVCFYHQHHLSAVMTAIACVVYEGIYIYFCVVINRYIHYCVTCDRCF